MSQIQIHNHNIDRADLRETKRILRMHRANPLAWEARKSIPHLARLTQVGPEYRDASANETVKRINFAA